MALFLMLHGRSVVGDDHHRFGVVDQELLEPLHRFDVHVVGWLIKQDKIRLLQKYFGQFNPHPPATAEFTGRPREILPRKAQTKQDDFYFELLTLAVF